VNPHEKFKAYEKKKEKATELFKSLARLLKKRRHGRVDEFFFSREKLPFAGKEYWFMHFASEENKSQLVLTFGRSDRKTEVNKRKASREKVAAFSWAHTGKKVKLFEGAFKLENSEGRLKTRKFAFKGKHPQYELSIGKKTRLKLKSTRKEVVSEFAGPLGVGFINLFAEATGKLEGKKFEGRGYLQKVVAVTPFVPWKWVRVSFPKNKALDFFAPRIPVAEYEFKSTAYYFDGKKRVNLGKASLKKLYGGRWLLSGEKFNAYLRAYAFKPFVLRGFGEFHYDEYFVACPDFNYGEKEAGRGIGIVEDAYGLIL
jgi:hypothetical protein